MDKEVRDPCDQMRILKFSDAWRMWCRRQIGGGKSRTYLEEEVRIIWGPMGF